MSEPTAEPRRILPAFGLIYDSTQHLSLPLIRLFTGLLLMPHGAQKLFGWFGGSPETTAQFFTDIGLHPAMPLVYIVGSVEFFGGLCLAVGFLTRPAAAAIFLVMFNAVNLVHLANGFFWTEGGFEYPLLWALLALAFIIRGGGPISVDRRIRWEF